MYWKIVYQSTAYARLFDAPSKQEHSVTRDIPATIDSVIERVNSKSYISALEELEREALDVKIREVLNSSTEKQWIDESQGVFGAS